MTRLLQIMYLSTYLSTKVRVSSYVKPFLSQWVRTTIELPADYACIKESKAQCQKVSTVVDRSSCVGKTLEASASWGMKS